MRGVAYSDASQSERSHRKTTFESVVAWAERIDSADYASVDDAVLPTAAAPAISLSLGVRSDPAYSIHLVRLLRQAGGDVEAVAADQLVRTAIAESKRRVELGLAEIARSVGDPDADIVVFDVEEGESLISRYAPYVVNPCARYSAGIVRRPGEAKITTMRNPWLDFPSVNLGKICARHGGGGHERVGSILLRGLAAQRAEEILGSILSEIRRSE